MKKSFALTYVISGLLFFVSAIIYGILSATKVINFEVITFLLCLLGMVVVLLPIAFTKLLKIEVNLLTLIIYEFQIIISMLVGTTWGVYDLVAYYDTFVHGCGGLLITLICYSIFINKNSNKNLHAVWVAIIAFSLSMALGTLWEIYEFSVDGILKLNTQRYASLDGTNFVGRAALLNTMLDICANTVGAIIGAIITFAIEKKNHYKSSYPALITNEDKSIINDSNETNKNKNNPETVIKAKNKANKSKATKQRVTKK